MMSPSYIQEFSTVSMDDHDPSVTLSKLAAGDLRFDSTDDKSNEMNKDAIGKDHDSIYGSVDEQVSQIMANMHRRKQETDKDTYRFVICENKVFSGKMANVKGLKTYLKHSNNAKRAYQQQEVLDEWGHGYVTKAEVQWRYSRAWT
jgi:tRNA G10  N-methylase Trm11